MTVLSEYRQLRAGGALLPSRPSSLVELTGEDRQRFLNGLVTCDVGRLEPQQGAYGFFADVKGHILADVVVRALGDRLWLELPSAVRQAMTAHLTKYIVADRVEVRPLEDWASVTLGGGRVLELLESLVGYDCLPRERWGHARTELFGHSVRLAAEERLGVPGVTLWVPAAEAPELREALLGIASPQALAAVGAEAAEVVRVEGQVPRFGRDFGPENLPQETGLQEAVSYDKGCYLGQEVIARLHYRGQPARRLCALRVAGAELPPQPTPLIYEGRQVGRATSLVRVPGAASGVGLGLLLQRVSGEGTALSSPDGIALEVLGPVAKSA